ncbi:MAG: hypothetical protein Q8Q11_02415, partial [bacterium]|nr:hypothetical protein [bacterium]
MEMQEKLLRRGLGELNQANREFLRGNLRLTHNHASLASDCLSDQRLEMQERKVEAALIQGRSARMMANLEVAENALRRARRLSWRGIDPVDCLHPAIELELLQLEEARGQFTQACHDYQALKRKLRPWPDLRLVAETRALACAVKTSDFDSAKRLNSGLELVLPGFNIREECGARRWQAIYGIRRGDFPFAEERLEDAGRVADNLGAPLE